MKQFLNTRIENTNRSFNYQLPNYFKKIGWALISVTLLIYVIVRSNGIIPTYDFGHYGLLLGAFIISISKEKIEDELIRSLRMKSYMISFLLIVTASILKPIFDYFFLKYIIKFGLIIAFKSFDIITSLLIIQMWCFHYFKKKSNE